jgi:hypothetical protein
MVVRGVVENYQADGKKTPFGSATVVEKATSIGPVWYNNKVWDITKNQGDCAIYTDILAGALNGIISSKNADDKPKTIDDYDKDPAKRTVPLPNGSQ